MTFKAKKRLLTFSTFCLVVLITTVCFSSADSPVIGALWTVGLVVLTLLGSMKLEKHLEDKNEQSQRKGEPKNR